MKLFILMAVAVTAFSQTAPRVGAVHTYTKTGTGNMAITFQAPSSSTKTYQFKDGLVYCSVAGTLDQFRNGTAATTTADSFARVNPDSTSATTLTVFHTSNSSTASAQVLPPIDVFAGAPGVSLDLSDIQIQGGGTTKNYTMSLTCSGTYRISVRVQEYGN